MGTTRSTRSTRSTKYVIEIEPPHRDNDYATINTTKNFGNNSSSYASVKSKQDAINSIRRKIKSWHGIDSILGRKGDKVTKKNLSFQSFTDEITLADVLGNQKLTDFLGG